MEIAFEFGRAIVSTVSRRITNLIIRSASESPRVQRRITNFGHFTNRCYVQIKYFGFIWFRPGTLLAQEAATTTHARSGIDLLRGTPDTGASSPVSTKPLSSGKLRIFSFLNTPTSTILAKHHNLLDEQQPKVADPTAPAARTGESKHRPVEVVTPGAGAKAQMTVKPLDDDQAFEIGVDMLAEAFVLSIMVSLVTCGIKIRRWKAAEVSRLQAEKIETVMRRITDLEYRLASPHLLSKSDLALGYTAQNLELNMVPSGSVGAPTAIPTSGASSGGMSAGATSSAMSAGATSGALSGATNTEGPTVATPLKTIINEIERNTTPP